jgi:hypothetical protein
VTRGPLNAILALILLMSVARDVEDAHDDHDRVISDASKAIRANQQAVMLSWLGKVVQVNLSVRDGYGLAFDRLRSS